MSGLTPVGARERALYEDVFASIPVYGDHSPGEMHVRVFLDAIGVAPSEGKFLGLDVLDCGCGTGKGALALAKAGFRVTLCDFVDGRVEEAKAHALPFRQIRTLWDDLRPLGYHDYTYCCDVLEHIPEALTMLVAHRLVAVARQGAFVSVATSSDTYGVWIGESLHKTVKHFTWWRDMFSEVAVVVDARDLLGYATFYLRQR